MTYQQFILKADTYEELDQTREEIPVEDGGEVHIIAENWQNNIKEDDYDYSSINLCRYNGDTDRNLHISFRPQSDMIVINRKIDDAWVFSEELRFKFSDWLKYEVDERGVRRGHFKFVIGFNHRNGHYFGASVEGTRGTEVHKPFAYHSAGQGRKSWYINYDAQSNRCFGKEVLIKYLTGDSRLIRVP